MIATIPTAKAIAMVVNACEAQGLEVPTLRWGLRTIGFTWECFSEKVRVDLELEHHGGGWFGGLRVLQGGFGPHQKRWWLSFVFGEEHGQWLTPLTQALAGQEPEGMVRHGA